MLLGVILEKPREQRRGFETEVDEARTGECDVEITREFAELVDHLLGEGARVLLFPFGEGEGTVGLEIAVRRVGYAHLGLKAAFRQTEPGGGGPKARIEVTGDVERKAHPAIEESRLALSKRDFERSSGRFRVTVLSNGMG
jgi:hypothetical protein